MSIPSNKQIQELLQMLVDRPVTVTKAKAPHKFLREPSAVAIYVDDADGLSGCCACDLSFTNYVGAALAMLPVGQADTATKGGTIDENLSEHTHEVLNVMASLYPDAGGRHVRLSEMLVSPPLPSKLAPIMRKPSERADLDVKVDGYQGGRMIFFEG